MLSKIFIAIKDAISALNAVEMQVWAIVILVIGAALIALHAAEHGSMIVGGSLALLQHKNDPAK